MKKSFLVWQVAGFVFVGVMGVFLHFLFDLTGQSVWVAPFSAVNESIGEHMKLLFFPMLLFAAMEYFVVGRQYPEFWCVKRIGILSATFLIPLLYYTLSAIFGTTPDWVNIAIFFLCDAIGFWLENRGLRKGDISCKSPQSAVWTLLLFAALFVFLTFFPPQIPLYADPLTHTYGF